MGADNQAERVIERMRRDGRLPGKMKHQELYGRKVDLSEWSLAAVDDGLEKLTVDLKKIILQAATEALEISIKDGGRAYFPIEWSGGEKSCDGYGGAPVHDPNIIYFGFPLCGTQYESCYFKADLREMINELIELVEMGEGGPIEGEDRSMLDKVATALRDCAAKLDEALKR